MLLEARKNSPGLGLVARKNSQKEEPGPCPWRRGAAVPESLNGGAVLPKPDQFLPPKIGPTRA